MKEFCRKHRLFLWLLCVTVLITAATMLIPVEPPDEEYGMLDYEDFLDELGFRESSNRYSAVNRFGYLGRYQMGKLALQEAGFMDENGAWTALANSYGIYSQKDFLKSKEGQDAAVRAYHERTYFYIKALDLDKYVGSSYCGVTVTRSGLLAACHLVGVVGIQKGLQAGQHVYDGNNVSAAVYMEMFAGYDISSIWTD